MNFFSDPSELVNPSPHVPECFDRALRRRMLKERDVRPHYVDFFSA
jgi:hypothetical protein